MCFILSSIQVGSAVLDTTCVSQELWVVRKTEVVGPTTRVGIMAASSSSAVEQLCSCTRASGSSPAYVGSPSSCGAWGTCEDWCSVVLQLLKL